MYCSQCGKEIPIKSEVCPFCNPTAKVQPHPEVNLPEESHRYQIICPIGKGGMGEVFKAKDLRLNRIVALKRLSPDIRDDYMSIRRFTREAKSIASLNHPNIVQVYDIGKDKQGYYISMEFIEGQTLKEKLAQHHTMSLEKALATILTIAETLRFAHERGIIHRDMKPSNIFLTKEENIKIMDFGLAQIKGLKSERDTESTVVMGTPAYMSPEQKNNPHRVDERSDIYSLGLVFCELLLGKLPRIIQTEQLPSIVRRIVNKALEEKPAHRYNNASELIIELKELRRSLEFKPEMFEPPGTTEKQTLKSKRIVAISLIILIIIIAGVFVAKFYPERVFFLRARLLSPSLDLNGIIYLDREHEDNAALINKEYVKTGESINGYKVLEISRNDVILTREGKKYILSFQQSHMTEE